ncbi:MAG: phospholipase A [Marinobacter sp.]|nr:phospholipase A [Marinobacter sp.]
MTAGRSLILATLLGSFSLQGLAQPSPKPDPDSVDLRDCALISEGVKRLLCYDRRNDPDKAREKASPERIDAVESATVNLTPESHQAEHSILPEQQASDTASAQTKKDGTDDDSGVMNALVDRYVATEKALFSFSGGFVPHRPTYLLPITYVSKPNQQPYSPTQPTGVYDDKLDNKEAKYQISFKVPLLTGVFDGPTTFWFGYTQVSFWQVYNSKNSAPFRETNYEPELFMRYQTDYHIGPGTLNGISIGINHQSNGRSDPQSRSWNRILANAAYSYDRWLFMVSPWYRLPENRKDDDNPDLEKYVGYADYWAVYKWNEDKTLSLKLRNNLRSDNKTSIQLGYSFPMGGKLKGFIQYYNGYGESLIDYNVRIHRIGIGVMLNDWL